MTLERYQELFGRVFDGELAAGEAEELAQGLGERPEWREDLHGQLVLWELWAQDVVPERSAEAFVAAWRQRAMAEADVPEFQAAVRTRLEQEAGRRRGAAWAAALRHWWWTLPHSAGLAWAAGVVAAAFVVVFSLTVPHSTAAAVTLRGEAVCPACVLHIGHEHLPAIRVGHGDTARIYYLQTNQTVAALQPYFCGGPTPAEATGREKTTNGHRVFEADTVRVPAAGKNPPKPKADERILFPL